MARALALAPEDPFNLIFVATYWVEAGKKAEALETAARHESDLASSYNLAAIWAQAGEGERALKLLRRHFYEYERYDAVRAKEMQEARDDIVFKSLHTAEAFLSLTSLADTAPSGMHQR